MTRRPRLRDDSGFTLLELVVALVIIMTVLTSVMPVLVGSLRTVAEAADRQRATAIAAEYLERMRSLPFDQVRAGLDIDDPTLTGDPYVVSASYRSPDGSTTEPLQTSNRADPPVGADPLEPAQLLARHVKPAVVENGVTYTPRLYVTRGDAGLGDAFWLNVVVSSTGSGGRQLRPAVARTLAAAPSGCGEGSSEAGHPFAGPCQPFLYASAGITPGSISLSPATSGAQLVAGLDVTRLEVALPSLTAGFQVEQVSRASGQATTSRSVLTPSDGSGSSGGATAGSAVDDDPATASGQTVSSADAPPQPSAAQSRTAGGHVLSATVTHGDTGSTGSATAAGTGGPCLDRVGAAMTNGQACASATAQAAGAGSTSAAVLDLGVVAGRDLPALPLASSGPASTRSRGTAARFVTPGATWCRSATGSGCAVAAAVRALGTTTLGRLPSASVGDTVPGLGPDTRPGAPAGTTRPLLELVGYADDVVAQAQASGPDLANSAPTVTAGTLTWWNGSAFVPLDLATATPAQRAAVSVPTVSATYAATGGPITIAVSTTLSVGAPSRTATGSGPCATACVLEARVAGPLTATASYTITQGSTTIGAFTVALSTGDLLGTATYKAGGGA